MTSPPAGYAHTGVTGLDDVLSGGLKAGHLYLLEGYPGSGKTTIALQFLISGATVGERGLYITLSETESELREGAASHGWEIAGDSTIVELAPPESLLDDGQRQSLLYSSELELGETVKLIFDAVDRIKPARVIIDSLSEIRLLAQSSLRYRRQILAMKHYLARHGATVLMLDDMSSEPLDKTVHSVAHGVVRLEELSPDFGAERRRLRVLKYRAHKYRGGFHDFTIARGGVRVFPRLRAAEHHVDFHRGTSSSGIRELDQLLGNGIEQGSSVLLMGPAGTGKSLVALLFACAAIRRGERAALFVFDEEIGLLTARMRKLGFDIEDMRRTGSLLIEQIDAAETSPGEFAHRVRATMDDQGVRTVIIDSMNGYHAAMPEEKSLILHLHELLQYLNRRGATTFVTLAQHGLVGDPRAPVDITYIADTVILLRYFEAMGEVRRAVSIIKKRSGSHESTIREYRIGHGGIIVGEPLTEFQGVLAGTPVYTGPTTPLLQEAAI